MAPPASPNARSSRRRPVAFAAAVTALVVVGTPTVALGTPGSGAHGDDSASGVAQGEPTPDAPLETGPAPSDSSESGEDAPSGPTTPARALPPEALAPPVVVAKPAADEDATSEADEPSPVPREADADDNVSRALSHRASGWDGDDEGHGSDRSDEDDAPGRKGSDGYGSQIIAPAPPPSFGRRGDDSEAFGLSGGEDVPDDHYAPRLAPAAAVASAIIESRTAPAPAPAVPAESPAAETGRAIVHRRAGKLPARPESIAPSTPPSVILPPPATRTVPSIVAKAPRSRSATSHRPPRVAAGVASAAKVAVAASRSPWLPIGLLAVAAIYILGQRAMDRGSKLSYAGRSGEPDDEIIEI